MNKILSVLLGLIIFTSSAFAQGLTSSPYSQFGIGEINTGGSYLNKSFGGGGTGYASGFSLNLNNPATYSVLGRTTGDFLFENRCNFYQTSASNSFQNNVSMYMISLGFPVNKRTGVSFGLLPYASKGYKLSYYKNVENVGLANYQYQGNGNVNRVYAGTGVKILKQRKDSLILSAGINGNYLFGKLKEFGLVQYHSSYNLLSVQSNTERFYSGFYADPSLFLNVLNKDSNSFSFGVSYLLNTKLNSYNTYYSQSYYLSSTGAYNQKDLITDAEDTTVYSLPSGLKAGVSYTRKNIHTFLADYSIMQFNQSYDNRIKVNPLQTLSIGYQYIPRQFQSDSKVEMFFNKSIYRFSVFHNQLPVILNGKSITETGATIFFSFPTSGKYSHSRANLGITAGTCGTTSSNLIRHSYVNFTAGITFGEYWFQRFKID